MLTSVDLFTGIAGFTLALRGIAEPLAYCDTQTAFVDSLIERGMIPRAPVVKDVRDTSDLIAAVGSREVDIVTAGFPCVGFSVVGAKRGLDDERSGLFHAAAEVIAALRPKMAMFENVASILSHIDDMASISRTMAALGYDLRWTLCSAADVGAPHRRNRWFCLATRRGVVMPDVPVSSVEVPNFDSPWDGQIVSQTERGFGARFSALGNALVPLAARLAFARLYTGFEVMDVADLEQTSCLRFKAAPESRRSRKPPKHGFSSDWVTFSTAAVPALTVKGSTSIRVDPAHHDPGEGYEEKVGVERSPRIMDPYGRKTWPTPRASAGNPSHVLSARSACDLSTLALFASSVDGRTLPRTLKGDTIDVGFVEWMMGFPVGWTTTDARTGTGARNRERPRTSTTPANGVKGDSKAIVSDL
jgi:site-specific DNA-cytosine methylase